MLYNWWMNKWSLSSQLQLKRKLTLKRTASFLIWIRWGFLFNKLRQCLSGVFQDNTCIWPHKQDWTTGWDHDHLLITANNPTLFVVVHAKVRPVCTLSAHCMIWLSLIPVRQCISPLEGLSQEHLEFIKKGSQVFIDRICPKILSV